MAKRLPRFLSLPRVSRSTLLRHLGNVFAATSLLVLVAGTAVVLWFVFVKLQEKPGVSPAPFPQVDAAQLEAKVKALDERADEFRSPPKILPRNVFGEPQR